MLSLWLAFGLLLIATRQAYGINLASFQSLATNVTQSFNISSLPAPCAALCNTTLNSANECATFSCLCTTAAETNITGCVNCIVAVKPSEAVIQQAQGIVDQFVTSCDANNASLVTQTVSGFTFTTTSTTGSSSSIAGSTSTNTSTSALPTSTTPTTVTPPSTTTGSSGAVPAKMDVFRCSLISMLAFTIAVLL